MNVKKNESNNLLLEIIRKKTLSMTNEFKGGCLYLSTENITVTELGKLLGKQVNRIVEFF